jgi:hypothetical protein
MSFFFTQSFDASLLIFCLRIEAEAAELYVLISWPMLAIVELREIILTRREHLVLL